MNYYTSTIQPTLAWKIKGKGMSVWTEGHSIWCPSYAEVFDWLMSEKEIILYLDAKFHRWFWRIESKEHGFGETEEFEDWHEAAEKAIEKALTLI